jgi:pimeloyl-ACP methyl ester carboxylesterase
MAAEAGITEAEIQAHSAGRPQEKGPLNWEWVQAILKALERTPLGERALDRLTRDVYVYLTNRVVRRTIDGIVQAAIGSGPSVVVGHSLGSVVGYNVLRAAPAAARVGKYGTVGSPLGLTSIKRRLETPLTMPRCVLGWYNAMDERDVVALHPLNERHFGITPAIENQTTVKNHTDNRHGIIGYLDDVDVARVIHAAIEAIPA